MFVERNPNEMGGQSQSGSSPQVMGGQPGTGNGSATAAPNAMMNQNENPSEDQGMGPNGRPKGIDYRDDLRELLDKAHAERGLTRYRLCKQMGIDSGTLSNVLAKRRHFSLEKLEQILHLLGYRLSFTKDGQPMSMPAGQP